MDKQFQIPDGIDQKFYYRMDMTPPVLRIGWQTDQAANSKDLSFRVNPAFYQANPRLGKNPTSLTAVATDKLADTYDLPLEIPATGTSPKVEGAKYCVRKSDKGLTNALGTADTSPHVCSAGNTPAGATAAAGLQTIITEPNWYVNPSGTPAVTLAPAAATLPVGVNTDPSLNKPWGIPCYPTLSALCSPHEVPKTALAGGSATDSTLVSPGEPGMPRKYQYWAIKLKPYIETQFSLQNKIYIDQFMQLDFNIEV